MLNKSTGWRCKSVLSIEYKAKTNIKGKINDFTDMEQYNCPSMRETN